MSRSKKPFPSVTREFLRKNPDARAAAEELNLHISTVYRHASDMDLKLIAELRSMDWDTKEIIKYMSLVLGFKKSEVAKKMGYTIQYISQVLSESEEVAA